jgi:hypothetical protein
MIGFKEQSSNIFVILADYHGFFLELKISIILIAGVIGAIIYSTKNEKALDFYTKSLIILNAITVLNCVFTVINLKLIT